MVEAAATAAVAFVVAGLISYLATRLIIPILTRRGFVGTDLHKDGGLRVAEMGGIGLVLGLVISIVVFVIIERSMVLAVSAVILFLLALVGFYDDIKRIRGRVKLVICFLISLVLLLIVPLDSSKFLESVLPMSLLSVALAIGVAAAANAANILAGFNGLEAGTTAIAGASVAFIAVLGGSREGVIISLALVAACLSFLWFNRFPARIFPGDVGTLPMGGALALAAIIAKAEFVGPVLFAPHLIELICKLKNKFAPKELTGHASLGSDGKLRPGNYAAFVHFLMKTFPSDEKRLVHIVWAIESILGILAFLLFLVFLT